ncbi:LytR/AlgR family response regulator transcription factor [Planctobacterium marinum]|uniref:HTH LytTR-type domain-containing protein n=1 Tax=Planctobacterium marinum TaxID=1631968 RepID=A0AA48KMX2_9ALTE|nr:hypothetical protein MACH26_04120 [Planctobacterium marinum]
MTMQQYLRHKTHYEVLFWGLFIIWQVVANVYVALNDAPSLAPWEPVLWEISSTLVFAALLPLLLWFDSRFPVSFATLKRNIFMHALFTIPFSAMHVTLMVLIREAGYWFMGRDYNFGPWGSEFLYEYAKDFRTYFYLLVIIYLYRLVLFRAQGEASVPGTSDDDSQQSTPAIKQHLLVKKLGKEFLVKIEDIEWLEACGNYVNLHVAGRAYPYRGTMKSLEEQLDSDKFLRVHRSYMVNYNQVQSIEPLESGDAKIQLHQGQELPFSRRYRADFKPGL